MANLSSNDPNGRLFPYTSTHVSTISALPPVSPAPPSFSNFQFKTIGQQPALLQRISAPGLDTLPYQHLDRSPSLSPDLPNVPSSSERLKPGQPSLQARLSMLDPSDYESNAMNIDLRNINPVLGRKVSTSASQKPASTISDISLENRDVDDCPPGPIPFVSNQPKTDSSRHSSAVPYNAAAPASSSSNASLSLPSNIALSPNPSSLANEPSLASLRALQMRISSAISNLRPVSITDALQLAQSAKEHCTKVNSSARQANELAQQALRSAQQSVDAARQCLAVAGSIQLRADEVMTAVEKISSAQGTKEWNDALDTLKDNSHLLEQWVRDREAQEAKRLRELKDQSEHRKQDTRGTHSNSIVPSLSSPSSTDQSNSLQSSAIGVDISDSISPPLMVEDDSATQALKREREEREERNKQIAANFQRRRLQDEIKEQAMKKEQEKFDVRAAEFAQRRAERIAAEEQEKARQEQEEKEAEIKQKALERTREEVARRASEQRALEAAMEKQKSAQLQKEQDDRIRIEEKAKRLEREQADAEQQRIVQLKLQEQQASVEAAKRIQDERAAKSGQGSPVDKIFSPTTSATSFPIISPPQAIYDCGNVVSKKTLLTGSPGRQQTGVSDRFRAPIASSDPFALPSSSMPANAPSQANTTGSVSVSIPGLSGGSQMSIDPSSVVSSSNHREEEPVTPVGHGLANTDKGRTNQVSHPLPWPRRQNGLVVPSRIAEDNKGLPESRSLSKGLGPATPTPPEKAFATDVSVDTEGSDIGNLPLLPRSLVPSISPEAQKANLRRLMDANGIPQRPTLKREADTKPLVKLEQQRQSEVPVPHYQVSTSASRDQNGAISPIKIGPPRKKTKTEPPEDIPLLSLPSPTDKEATLNQSTASSATASKPQLPDFNKDKPIVVNPAASSQNVSVASANERPPLRITVGPGGPPTVNAPLSLSPTLPRRPELPLGSAPLMSNRVPIGSDEGSRVRPDVANMDGRLQPSLQGMPDHRQRLQARAPRPMVDHYSPAAAPAAPLPSLLPSLPPALPPATITANRRPSQRQPPPWVDHYSPPRRTPEPLPTFTAYSNHPGRPPAKSKGSGSDNNSRGPSPDRALHNSRSMSSEIVPPIGRKRLRDDQDVGSPPRRRARYGDHLQPREGGHYHPGPRYPSIKAYQDEWSHTAEYGRSPSPELPQQTPLSQRIEPEPERRPPFSGYREGQPIRVSGQRYDQQNQRRQANPQPVAQGSDHPYQNNNPPTQNYRNYDSPPQLLNRFSDSTKLRGPPSDVGYHPNKGPRPRILKQNHRDYRPTQPPPLEQRIANKGSLINRLEGMQNQE
ncbi:hypothetical protein GALMADRAFT_249046 [Galerina marginata CBS 339.88]|uniref:Uncharacterized protein n=1 Tax=Galerina marginata (strain CBS 339.88) TaxID=685588 RepID=A0A067SW15_GALM3|nr:hypothetical protein GALMADRAFT_249046 [Galerina marginata CBS 339.88]